MSNNKPTQVVDFSNPNADRITSGSTKPMTNETKQTAVEWLVEKLENEATMDYSFSQAHKLITLDIYSFNQLIQQAKEMEKERMIQFAKKCLDKALDLDVRTAYSQVEKYYEQTYGGNK